MLTLPSKNVKWVKIYPDGNRLTGEMIYTGEGSGYSNQPDDYPGLTIYRYDSEISLRYVDQINRQLIIGIPHDSENMKLSAHYSDGKYVFDVNIFNNFTNLWEVIGDKQISVSYNGESNTVEKNLFLNDEKTPWEGTVVELTPETKWMFRAYTNGKIVLERDNLTIDGVNDFRKKFSEPSDMDYHHYAWIKLQSLHKLIADKMDIPLIFNKNYDDLDREYFGQRIFLPD
jgi:hypothetical protein